MRPDSPLSRSLLVVGLLLVLGSPAQAAERTPQQAIEEGLMCYCGCVDLTVRVCTCGTAATIRQEIVTRLANGENKEEVLAAFVARHGEQILSAPTKEGFNLLAWIMPFAVILIAATALIVFIRRSAARGALAMAGSPAQPFAANAELSDAQRQTLERIEREIQEEH
jgi:cytochrome c-type biogenesis protein CcmH